MRSAERRSSDFAGYRAQPCAKAASQHVICQILLSERKQAGRFYRIEPSILLFKSSAHALQSTPPLTFIDEIASSLSDAIATCYHFYRVAWAIGVLDGSLP